ncbi:hypothetical protein IT774_13475 [Salinimonas marina]|uniref:Uncharacterized protein n=1 Tax=Salinimonas marina TaxID=2785918 RepID=A0A7S9DWA6_9ALTE|nr:hypothetical protein [Salinimonas marina]QPG05128.1 hypothetical protein IT774_13475 [Salinimonas marina]
MATFVSTTAVAQTHPDTSFGVAFNTAYNDNIQRQSDEQAVSDVFAAASPYARLAGAMA